MIAKKYFALKVEDNAEELYQKRLGMYSLWELIGWVKKSTDSFEHYLFFLCICYFEKDRKFK